LLILTNLIENKTGRIQVPDFTPDSFTLFLTLLYTYTIPKISSLEEAFQLYFLVDKYQCEDHIIREVKIVCERFITVDNVTYVLRDPTLFNFYPCCFQLIQKSSALCKASQIFEEGLIEIAKSNPEVLPRLVKLLL